MAIERALRSFAGLEHPTWPRIYLATTCFHSPESCVESENEIGHGPLPEHEAAKRSSRVAVLSGDYT